MKIDLRRFRTAFFEEADEHLSDLERDLLRLEDAPHDAELLNAIFRAAHSIKGSGGMLGLDDVARYAHVLEHLLESMRSRETVVTPDLIELLLRARDVLGSLLSATRAEAAVPDEVEPMLEALGRAVGEAAPAPRDAGSLAGRTDRGAATAADAAGVAAGTPTSGAWRIRFAPDAGIFRTGLDPLLVLRDLATLGTVRRLRADLDALPALADLDPETCHLAWSLELETTRGEDAVREVFLFVEDDARVEIAFIAPPAKATPPARTTRTSTGSMVGVESTTIRVSTVRVDELINLVGELVIAQSMVDQLLDGHVQPELRRAIDHLEINLRQLQETMLSVRMVPVATLFQRFQRLVRDVSSACGKDVRLQLSGEETELDKSVIEVVADPLMHLVRNAIDHGLEEADVRTAAGKPAEGVVHMSAYHESGNVVIEVEDDGSGLDNDRILARARERGLVAAGDELDEARIHALILEPGFSTADEVSDISGRGVGLDVVRRNIDAISGRVSIESRPGQGTCFRIQLPLTLAILDTLSVSIGGRVHLLPLLSVVESVRPGAGDVRTVMGHGEIIQVRGHQLPLVRLGDVLGIDGCETDPCRGLVVIVEHEGQRLGLLVDALLGQCQAFVKNLETNFRRVEGLMGATILGDGTVAFILDVHGVARLAARSASSVPEPPPNPTAMVMES